MDTWGAPQWIIDAHAPDQGPQICLDLRPTAKGSRFPAGGKVVGMYGTMSEGPGAIAIFDAEPVAAPAVGAVVASSDGVHDFKMMRLYTMEEVISIRQKRIQLQSSYKPPGH